MSEINQKELARMRAEGEVLAAEIHRRTRLVVMSPEAYGRAMAERLLAERDSLKAQLAEAKEVLRVIEADSHNCPWPDCHGERELKPHAPGCRLARLLEEK